ncbi:MAG: hypothetical protein GW946_02085 [Candidatus Pacebacteria bacterium]|nr:hypothetical protein [Candidatus Paceibacterota bacterium]
MQPTHSSSRNHKRTNSHIMGFFALLLLIVVVAISVDRLKQSQDVRKEAAICPDGQCDPPAEEEQQQSVVSLTPLFSGPQHLYDFYDYDVDPPQLHNLEYKLSYEQPNSQKARDELTLTLIVPANTDNDSFVLNSNLSPAITMSRQEQIIGDNKEITLSFSGLLPHWQSGTTTVDLGIMQLRPTKLGHFFIAIPTDKNPLISVLEGSKLVTTEILPSLTYTKISLQPSATPGDTYSLQFTMRNINSKKAINPRWSSIFYYPPEGGAGSSTSLWSIDLPSIPVGGEFTANVSIAKELQLQPEVGGKFTLNVATTPLREDFHTFLITQEILDQVNAQIFYDLSLAARIADSYTTTFPVEYELEINNSTNETSTPVIAKFVGLEIETQPGVTLSTPTHASQCSWASGTLANLLTCVFDEIGVITPLLIQATNTSPGDLIFINKLTVIGNPKLETNTENNTLTLTTTVTEPVPITYRTADIYPIGNPDKKVDIDDYRLLAENFNKRNTDADWETAKVADIIQDGWIDLDDYAELIRQFSPAGY